jgi:hypothetical protein
MPGEGKELNITNSRKIKKMIRQKKLIRFGNFLKYFKRLLKKYIARGIRYPTNPCKLPFHTNIRIEKAQKIESLTIEIVDLSFNSKYIIVIIVDAKLKKTAEKFGL